MLETDWFGFYFLHNVNIAEDKGAFLILLTSVDPVLLFPREQRIIWGPLSNEARNTIYAMAVFI